MIKKNIKYLSLDYFTEENFKEEERVYISKNGLDYKSIDTDRNKLSKLLSQLDSYHHILGEEKYQECFGNWFENGWEKSEDQFYGFIITNKVLNLDEYEILLFFDKNASCYLSDCADFIIIEKGDNLLESSIYYGSVVNLEPLLLTFEGTGSIIGLKNSKNGVVDLTFESSNPLSSSDFD